MRNELELNQYGETYQIALRVASYEKGNLAIQMLCWSEEDKWWLPWSCLTVNLDGEREKDHAFIDTNNNGEEILAWIIRYGLAVPTGKTGRSGFCSYPEYRFKEEVLRELDSDGYEEYLMWLKRDREGKKNKKSA